MVFFIPQNVSRHNHMSGNRLVNKKGKKLEYKMPNNQMPNYLVQTQYVSIRSTS